MKKNKGKILYISSLDPCLGPGAIAMSHYNAFKNNGYNIDFVTLLPVENHPEIKYIIKKPHKRWSFHQIRFRLLRRSLTEAEYTRHYFFYLKDNCPPEPIRKVLKKINDDYDYIIVYFWQRLLSYKSVLEIYKKCKNNPKVVFFNADYSTMTGGCHFVGDCDGFKTGCGKCPMIKSNNPNDFTAWNAKYRRKVIETLKPYVFTNTYTKTFFNESYVMSSGAKFCSSKMLLDTKLFAPQNSLQSREKYNVSSKYKFIILFGCQNLNDEKKGVKYLIESLNIFKSQLTPAQKEEILLLTIGGKSNTLPEIEGINRIDLGYVDVKQLPTIYSCASVFLSPSVNDAGPSMVNQSISCGLPVIAFEMGTAIDVVKNQGTGICVPLKDTKAFADAILRLYTMNFKDYNQMCHKCREVALANHSEKAYITNFERQVNDVQMPRID